ncbi:hypothetical protein SO802_013182 [Lithocarpus litseifolius]|uniref:Uncharacterized protein n=1 Tax=Lithocarpus litseifolius TaxID=425828 RepID=A0AAW2D5M2_9ROSI
MNRARDRFDVSGPTHLKAVDWNNSDHRRFFAASLVQGVYVQENDRQQQLQEPHAPPLAQPWWEFFHFQLSRVLLDNVDKSIFGAIYEFISLVPTVTIQQGSPQNMLLPSEETSCQRTHLYVT